MSHRTLDYDRPAACRLTQVHLAEIEDRTFSFQLTRPPGERDEGEILVGAE